MKAIDDQNLHQSDENDLESWQKRHKTLKS